MSTDCSPSSARRVVPALAIVACVALLLGACSSTKQADQNTEAPTPTAPPVNAVGAVKAGPADSTPTKGGKITYGIDGEPEGLDPTRYAFTQAGHAVASAVFDPLATLDENGNVIPYLAKAFEPNADYTSWTVVLPEGVTFHDGSPFNADTLVTNLEAYRNSAITGAPVKAEISSFAKVDSTHVRIQLPAPIRNFPVIFTTQIGYVFSPEMLTNTDLAKKPVGTGPFVYENHEDGKFWSFKRNPNYRQPNLPYLDAIEFQPIADNAERNNKLRAGDLDMIQTYAGPQVLELRSSDYKRVENQHGDKALIMMNTAQPPFDNVNARKAVALASDSAKWRKDIYADVAAPANSPFGPGQPGYLVDNGYPAYNLEAAKQAVQQYKTETGNDLEFTFLAAADATYATVAQFFAKGFEQAGMKVNIQQLPQINLLATVATGKYQLSNFRLFGAPNPDADVNFYRSTSVVPDGISINFPRYASPEVDAAVSRALATDDPAARNAAYETISKNMGANVPFVWLGQLVWVVAANPRVNGIYGAMNGSIPIVGPKTWIQSLSITK